MECIGASIDLDRTIASIISLVAVIFGRDDSENIGAVPIEVQVEIIFSPSAQGAGRSCESCVTPRTRGRGEWAGIDVDAPFPFPSSSRTDE